MIKSFEELGEVLADFETRLLYLENSQPYKEESRTEEPRKVVVEHIRSYVAPPKVGKLKEDLEELEHNFNEHTKHLSVSKRKSKYD